MLREHPLLGSCAARAPPAWLSLETRGWVCDEERRDVAALERHLVGVLARDSGWCGNRPEPVGVGTSAVSTTMNARHRERVADRDASDTRVGGGERTTDA